jgi:hypothetical protein
MRRSGFTAPWPLLVLALAGTGYGGSVRGVRRLKAQLERLVTVRALQKNTAAMPPPSKQMQQIRKVAPT